MRHVLRKIEAVIRSNVKLDSREMQKSGKNYMPLNFTSHPNLHHANSAK